MTDQIDSIDLKVLMTLKTNLQDGDDDSFFREMVSLYLEDTPLHLVAIRENIGAANGERVKNAAHTLKGSSSNFGARRMIQLCAALEHKGLERDFPSAAELLDELEAEFARVSEILSTI